jgi:hypothetical protein
MRLLPHLMLGLLVACNSHAQIKSPNQFKLIKTWEAKGFDTPESIILDTTNKILYVSNIGGKDPGLKDSNGFISRLKLDGTIDKLQWVTGLNAPKGMCLVGAKLYVTDIDKVVVIDIKEGKIVNSIPVEGSGFLNDIAATGVDELIISDSQMKCYFKVIGDKVTMLAKDESFASPNGILFEKGKVISGVGDRIIRLDPLTGKWEDFITGTGGVDGLQKIADDVYIVSDWTGHISIAIPAKPMESLLDTTLLDRYNAADLFYDSVHKRIFVPTFYGNSISCYQLSF